MSGGSCPIDHVHHEGYPKLTVVLGIGEGRPLRISWTSRANVQTHSKHANHARYEKYASAQQRSGDVGWVLLNNVRSERL